MSKPTKSRYQKLFEEYDAELNREAAALDAGVDTTSDTPDELDALGVSSHDEKPEETPKTEEAPSVEEEGDKFYIEINAEQLKMLKAIFGKIAGKSEKPAAPTEDDGSVMDDAGTFGMEAPAAAEDEEVLTDVTLSDEEIAFLDELYDELVLAEEGSEPEEDETAEQEPSTEIPPAVTPNEGETAPDNVPSAEDEEVTDQIDNPTV